jgi:hypothetical protein
MSIQKCKPSFEAGESNIQRAPFTQIYNKVIQNCTNTEAGWVWVYLQSQCDNWELNPNQLKKHFKFGKNKIYAILTFMISAKLLVRHVQISANGRRVKTTYTVLDGMDYVDPAKVSEDIVQECAPLPQYPEVENPEVVNRDYKKERGLKKKEEDIKEISLIDSATDVAQVPQDDAFDKFWDVYPVKKNKVRAKRIWDREKFTAIVVLICCDVMTRTKQEPQWQDKQFIPHPSTYLTNKLWNDEVTKTSNTPKSSGKSSSFDKYLADLKQQGGNTYEHGGISQ